MQPFLESREVRVGARTDRHIGEYRNGDRGAGHGGVVQRRRPRAGRHPDPAVPINNPAAAFAANIFGLVNTRSTPITAAPTG